MPSGYAFVYLWGTHFVWTTLKFKLKDEKKNQLR